VLTQMTLTVGLLAGCALAQNNIPPELPPETIAPPTSSSSFLGTWEGQGSAGTWITIKLVETGGKIFGTIARDRTALDADQENEVRDWVLKGRVVNVKTRGRVLTFNVESKGAMDTYEMVLRDDSQAAIHKVVARAESKSAVKPWPLTKTSGE